MKKSYMKIRSLVGAFGLLAITASAQINGVVTINSASPTAGTNYATFNALATVLNGPGVNGPLTVNVAPGTYIEQVQFNVISGAGGSNRIVINGNGATLQFNSSNAALPHTMALNGTDYLTVNNLNMVGQGSLYAMVCVLTNGADNNRFTNCTFQCPLNSSNTSQVPFSISSSMTTPSGGTNSGNFNTVSTSTMMNGYYGVFFYGLTASPFNTNNTVKDCWVTDFYYMGIYFYYQKNCVVANNTVDRLTRTSSTTTYGMYGPYQSGSIIEGNKVHKLFQSNQGAAVTCYPMYIYYTSTPGGPRNTVRNNVITDIRNNSTIYGMYCYYMNADIYNNTIDLDWLTGTSYSGTIYAMYPYGTAGYNNTITNNIVTVRRAGSGTRYGIYIAATGNIALDRNDIVVTTTLASSYLG